jgi:selenocysteine-specific elongation factor
MPVVGTAGHVDHGKSTLVMALTGRDPDRWDEEKQRGLTIDLGFAWTELDDGLEVGFVDVPGHERFIKNMLAGVDGIDAALLVVAADEGWMPQSEEHLAVLDLLDIRHGVVALTRTDLVDDDLAQLAALEVEERLEGTSLQGAPVVAVAAPLGTGLDLLRSELASAVRSAVSGAAVDRPRLWVDRSFVITGAGTVVTGTLVGGALAAGDTVMVYPEGRTARIRSLQSHERSEPVVGPGRRTAANLVGLERAEVARGAMVARPGQWRVTARALVALRAVRSLDDPLGSRGAYHLHFGSGAWPVRLRTLGEPRSEVGPALLSLQDPLPMAMGDRFVLRDVGRRRVVGGGRILDPHPADRGPDLLRSYELLEGRLDDPPDSRAAALVALRGRAGIDDLAADSAGGVPREALLTDGEAFDGAAVGRITEEARDRITAYQTANPLRPGHPKASLATHLGVSVLQLEELLAPSDLVDDGAAVRTGDFAPGWGASEEAAWAAARRLLTAEGLAIPRTSHLGLDQEVLHTLVREGSLIRIDDDLTYLPEQVEQILDQVGALGDGFTVADFRDALGITRRHAVPLLEWLDRTGVTVRRGDTRSVRRPRPARPAPGADPTP